MNKCGSIKENEKELLLDIEEYLNTDIKICGYSTSSVKKLKEIDGLEKAEIKVRELKKYVFIPELKKNKVLINDIYTGTEQFLRKNKKFIEQTSQKEVLAPLFIQKASNITECEVY